MLVSASFFACLWGASNTAEDWIAIQVRELALTCAAWGLAVAFVTGMLKIA
jgi:hypothetical protein